MNNKFKFFKYAGITLLLGMGLYFVGFYEPYLEHYKCKNSISAQNCSDCEPTGQKSKFLIDKNQNTVLQKTWIKTKLVGSEYLEGCIVTNDNNWICKRESKFNDLTITDEEKMIDGLFIMINEWIRGANFSNPLNSSSYWCAK